MSFGSTLRGLQFYVLDLFIQINLMKKFWAVNQIEPSKAEILLYGFIGEEVTAGDFVKEFKELSLTNTTINVRINSGGGSIFEGLAIYNALKNSKVETIGYIDGLCASMATVLALALDKVYMSKNAMFMTHKASGFVGGNSNAMKAYADMMDSLEDVIATVYAAKTGLSKEDAKTKFLSAEDKWFDADQALTEKLIDGIYDDTQNALTIPVNLKTENEIIGFYNSHLENFKNFNIMKQVVLSADQLTALNLKVDSDQSAITMAITGLIAKAAKVDELTTQLGVANTEKKNAETKLSESLKATNDAKVVNLLDTALNTDKKITKAQYDLLKAQYETNPEGLSALLIATPKIVSITNELKGGESDDFKGTWSELDKGGKLESLKAKNIDLFKQKFKAEFCTDYKG